MRLRATATAIAIVSMFAGGAGKLCAAPPPPGGKATSPFPGLRPLQLQLSGRILGNVRNTLGVGQLGAIVFLYNKYDQVVRQAMTNENGQFLFDSISPDTYTIRVSLSSFVPALKRGISVQAGVDSVLNVNLASVLSTIELVRATPGQSLMSDDWKWALRSAPAARPVMRVLPGIDIRTTTSSSKLSSAFSETRGLFNVSAGDAADISSMGPSADLGTAFAVATSLRGANRLQFSGNLGYVPRTGLPTAGFSATFSRNTNGWRTPEVTLSARQMYLPNLSGRTDVPSLRTMSMSTIDRIDIGDSTRLEYGASIDSIALFDRMTYVSPFARVTRSMGSAGALQFGFSSGAPPMALFSSNRPDERDSELHRDLALLAAMPRLTMLSGRTRMQRSTNLEIGFNKQLGSTTLRAAVYKEHITNAAIQMTTPYDLFVGEILPDLGSRSSMFNAGSLDRTGFMTSATRPFGERLELTLSAGRGGALAARNRELTSDTPQALRADLQSKERDWASVRLTSTMPVTGTRFTGGYSWTDYSVMMPGHVFLTQQALPETGLNLGVRQPVPSLFSMPGRFELSLDLRNMLAQGYVPIRTSQGQQLQLIQAPRALRGGFSFIF